MCERADAPRARKYRKARVRKGRMFPMFAVAKGRRPRRNGERSPRVALAMGRPGRCRRSTHVGAAGEMIEKHLTLRVRERPAPRAPPCAPAPAARCRAPSPCPSSLSSWDRSSLGANIMYVICSYMSIDFTNLVNQMLLRRWLRRWRMKRLGLLLHWPRNVVAHGTYCFHPPADTSEGSAIEMIAVSEYKKRHVTVRITEDVLSRPYQDIAHVNGGLVAPPTPRPLCCSNMSQDLFASSAAPRGGYDAHVIEVLEGWADWLSQRPLRTP